MKPCRIRPTQLQLGLDIDESQIWDTLQATTQQQITERLARLWMQYISATQAMQSGNVTDVSLSEKIITLVEEIS